MDIPWLDPAWHNFWYWFDHLSTPDKIAYWSFLSSLVAGPFIGLLAALVGAWLGARAAFKLARNQQIADEKTKRVSALLKTQFAIYSQWNVIEGMRRTHLEKRREHPTRFLQMPEIYSPDIAQPVPFDDIAFIVEYNDANLLQEIQIAEQCYKTCFESFKVLRREQKRLHKNPAIKKTAFNFETGVGMIEGNERDVYMLKSCNRQRVCTGRLCRSNNFSSDCPNRCISE